MPSRLRNALQVLPLKRVTNVLYSVPVAATTAQMAPPALSLVQLGADAVFAARFENAPQLAPLKTVAVSPPVMLRATQTTFPATKDVQLGLM
jgi:hypothetical protein